MPSRIGALGKSMRWRPSGVTGTQTPAARRLSVVSGKTSLAPAVWTHTAPVEVASSTRRLGQLCRKRRRAAAQLRLKSESRLRRYNAAFLSVAASRIEKQLGTEGMYPGVGDSQRDEST